MFDLLTLQEKRILQFFLVLLLGAVVFYVFIALKERSTYVRSVDTLAAKKRDYKRLNARAQEKESEWLSWRNAHEDMKELRKSYFYQEEEGYSRLRLSLQRIFNESRVNVSDIRYHYTMFDKEKIKKVSISFRLGGSYFSLKKLINAVENLSKFLLVEKIDFIDTPAEGGPLKLKITLAGYYAT